jgi:hypothetical protein
MATLKKGTSRLTPTEMVDKARLVEQRMDGNAAFPNPTPSLTAIATAREALEAAITAAMDGGRTATAIRRHRFKELKQLLDQLAGYVSSIAEGNELAILSCGFEVRRNGPPAAEPAPPKGLEASLSAHPGRAELSWQPVKEALTYHVQVNRVSPDDASAWELVGVTTRSRTSLSGLASARVHWFRVAAIGTKGMGPWSDVAHTLIR